MDENGRPDRNDRDDERPECIERQDGTGQRGRWLQGICMQTVVVQCWNKGRLDKA